MAPTDFLARRSLGRTGLQVSRIGLAGGYRVPTRAVEQAHAEYGINYFYWEARRPGMRDSLRALATLTQGPLDDEQLVRIRTMAIRSTAEARRSERGLVRLDRGRLGLTLRRVAGDGSQGEKSSV